MPFEITPAAASPDGFSIGAEPVPPDGFAVGVEAAPVEGFAIAAAGVQTEEFSIDALPPGRAVALFIQWQLDGVDLGEPDVAIVDFVGDHLEATRGTGENSHVVTLRDVRDFLYYTSEPYPTEAAESMDAGLALPQSGFMLTSPLDALDAAVSFPLDGVLGETFLSNQPPDSIDAALALPQFGLLPEVYRTYTQPTENVDAKLAFPLLGSFPATLLAYTNHPAESIDAALALPLSGTLV